MQLFSKERAKQAGVALAVVTTIVVLIACLSLLFFPKNNSPESGMLEASGNGFQGEPKNTLDMVFLGDSRVYSSFSPLQLWHDYGFASYDVSIASQNLPYSVSLLKRVFKTHKPKVVALETDTVFIEFPILDGYLTELADVVPYFEYHSRWKNLTPEDIGGEIKRTWTDPLKGFRIHLDVKKYNDGLENRPINQLPKNAMRYFLQILELCKENGSTLLLVSAPSKHLVDDSHHGIIQELADTHGLSYIDLNDVPFEELGIDWNTDTFDTGEHLNYYGAKKTTDYMGAYLKSHYDLPDHRGDTAYESWDKCYDAYAAQIPAE